MRECEMLKVRKTVLRSHEIHSRSNNKVFFFFYRFGPFKERKNVYFPLAPTLEYTLHLTQILMLK